MSDPSEKQERPQQSHFLHDREALKTALAIAIVKERKKQSAETEAWRKRAAEMEVECDRLRADALSQIGLDREAGADAREPGACTSSTLSSCHAWKSRDARLLKGVCDCCCRIKELNAVFPSSSCRSFRAASEPLEPHHDPAC